MPEAGRVIAGTARGTRLRSPGGSTRPLGDRVKESLFASLQQMLQGARVLDLFAGSGAGGIEALSRGAKHCDFVERDAAAVKTIVLNLDHCGLADKGAVHRAEVLAFLQRACGPYDLVLVDPPYGDPVILAVLERLGHSAALAPGATVVAKHFWRDPLPEAAGRLTLAKKRRFGETGLAIYRANGGEEP
jgi:16S rRNA (guanine966-N2)-methyltransferase